MTISALPESAVRLLGATQAIIDPASVVKELIDNSLDARATSVSVEISANTLDAIQVRDNGHGIPPQDRLLVARPHCTSKIRDTEDLRNIGGCSLGFRGEALTSMAQLASGLLIGTRVEGEPVGTNLRINSSGEVDSHDPTPLAVGTSVKITSLLHASPVRKQLALKSADKCLKKIKQILHSYAFAHPQVRLSFRVLKAKQDTWVYAAKPNSSVEEVTIQLCGAACAAQCTWSEVESAGYTLRAYAPRVDADPVKVSGFGAFLSVDSRPVSAVRGTLHQISKLHREALKKANPSFTGASEPFLCLQIMCPTASYDANVEPSKDDVLFDEPEVILAAASKLFGSIYAPEQTSTLVSGGLGDIVRSAEACSDYDTTRPDPSEDTPAPSEWLAKITETPRGFKTNMCIDDDEILDVVCTKTPDLEPADDFGELHRARGDIKISNPWVMAKMNAPQRQAIENDPAGSTGMRTQALPGQTSVLLEEFPSLPTPVASSPPRTAQISGRSNRVAGAVVMRDGRMIGSHSLPPPVQLTPTSSPVKRPRQSQLDDPDVPNFALNPTHPLMTAAAAALAPRVATTTRPSKRTGQTRVNKPFQSPVQRDPERGKVWFDHVEKLNQASSSPVKTRIRDVTGDRSLLGPEASHVPLARPSHNKDMRDYLKPRAAQRPGLEQSMPHAFTGQTATGSSSSAVDENSASSPRLMYGHIEQTAERLSDGENRMPKRRKISQRHRRDTSETSDKRDEPNRDEARPEQRARTVVSRTRSLPRSKSFMLPLERVPEGQGTHNVRLHYTTNTSDIARGVTLLGLHDVLMSFRRGADLVAGDSSLRGCEPAVVRELALRLQNVLTSVLPPGELTRDLHKLMQDAIATHQTLFEDGGGARMRI